MYISKQLHSLLERIPPTRPRAPRPTAARPPVLVRPPARPPVRPSRSSVLSRPVRPARPVRPGSSVLDVRPVPSFLPVPSVRPLTGPYSLLATPLVARRSSFASDTLGAETVSGLLTHIRHIICSMLFVILYSL